MRSGAPGRRCAILMVVATVSAAALAVRASAASEPRLSPAQVEAWRSDLDVLAARVPEMHPRVGPFSSDEGFRHGVEELRRRLPSLTPHRAVAALARIVAGVGDGHTRLTIPTDPNAGFFAGHTPTAPPRDPGLVFHALPVRLRAFADGLYVVRAREAFQDLVGARVIELGGRPVADVEAAVAPLVSRDNPAQLTDRLPELLVLPAMLEAAGIGDGPARVAVTVKRDGRRRTVELEAEEAGADTPWLDARAPGAPPLSLQQPERSHWLTFLADTGTLYVHYRAVRDDPDETVEALAGRVTAALAAHPVARLVIDMRGNRGGDNSLNLPLLHALICSEVASRPGGLFALIDRQTFSAAMDLVLGMEQHLPVLFVGEDTGGRPNSCGDARKLVLPGTGLTVRVATLYWQQSDPRDERPAVAPHLRVEQTFAQWRDNRDVVLDSVEGMAAPVADPRGTWRGLGSAGYRRFDLQLQIRREGGGAPRVAVTAPALGVADAAATGVGLDGGVLSFRMPSAVGPLAVRVHLGGSGMAGLTRLHGRPLPFLLQRQTGDAPSEK